MISMQCPNCAYDVDDDANFCPQCRYWFRDESETEELQQDDDLFEEKPDIFTKKELKQLEIQLYQPTFLLILLISLGFYIVISPLSLFSITVSGIHIATAGGISVLIGLVTGLLFFCLTRRSLRKSRFNK